MHDAQQRFLTTLLGCVLGALMVLGGGLFFSASQSRQVDRWRAADEQPRRFVVEGTGLYRQKPDILRASFRLQGEGERAAAAQARLTEKTTSLLTALTRLGVQQTDLASGQIALCRASIPAARLGRDPDADPGPKPCGTTWLAGAARRRWASWCAAGWGWL